MNTVRLKNQIQWTIGLTLVLNLVFLAKDLSDDFKEGAGFWHIGPEILIVIGTVLTAVQALFLYMKMKERADDFKHQVHALKVENQNWQVRSRIHSEGLAREIDRQMTEWQLSEAEKEIAFLMLKGFSNKEIADVRSTSEHTIKQQSSAIYRKSNLGKRSEFSAFFLEDLLPARHSGPGREGPSPS